MKGILLLLTVLVMGVGCAVRDPRSARIHKVLPHLLDQDGQASLHPSLFERDAYQAKLRQQRELVGGLRFDILWSGPPVTGLELKLELRGSARTNAPAGDRSGHLTVIRPLTIPTGATRWTRVTLAEEEFRQVGEVAAWRASVVRGTETMASTQSFLW